MISGDADKQTINASSRTNYNWGKPASRDAGLNIFIRSSADTVVSGPPGY